MVATKSFLVTAFALSLLAACGSVSRESHEARGEGASTTSTFPATLPAATFAAVAPAANVAQGDAPHLESAAHAKVVRSAAHGSLLGAPSARHHDTRAKSAAPKSLLGAPRTWRIDGHVFPGISAMSDAEASALLGSYVMSNTRLVTPWERCDAAESITREMPVEEWFASYDARELDETDRETLHAPPSANVRVHDLTCKDGTLVELVEMDAKHVAVARDGAIFTATRI